jgi:deoxyribonuclease-4
MGEAGFARLLQDPRLRRLPFILETPKGKALDEDRMNLATMRRLATAPQEERMKDEG